MRTTEPIDGGSVETEDLVECKRRCGHCALGLWRRRVVEVGKGRGSIASLFFTNWMPVSAVHRSVLGVGWCVVLGLFVCCEVWPASSAHGSPFQIWPGMKVQRNQSRKSCRMSH